MLFERLLSPFMSAHSLELVCGALSVGDSCLCPIAPTYNPAMPFSADTAWMFKRERSPLPKLLNLFRRSALSSPSAAFIPR